MKKGSIGILIYATIGFLIGIYSTYIVSSSNFSPYWFIGPAFVILSLGMFIMRNWVRIAIITLSIFYILLNIFNITEPMFKYHSSIDPFTYTFLCLLSPVFFFCIYSLIYLTHPKVKEQFKKDGGS
jgi:hypothetical protein